MDVTTYLPTLINALGHLGGITAFGAFLLLLRRSVRTGSRAETGLPAAAAGLAVCWNAGSLAVLFSSPGSGASQILASLSFAVLSLLPCVLLHLALGTEYRWLRHGGYAVGGVASLSHLSGAFDFPMASHEVGVRLITYGFGALAVVAAVLLSRGRADHRAAGMRAFAAISLFLLAASFVHFGAEHGPGSWAHELLFHHAGIPLALFVLLQDYRFLLLDVFIRLLGAFLLAALFAAALLVLGGQLGLFEPRETGALSVAVFLILASVAIVAYPLVRDRLRVWVQGALFRRGNVEDVVGSLRSLQPDDENELLNEASKRIARFVSAKRWRLLDEKGSAYGTKVEILSTRAFDRTTNDRYRWAEVVVPFRFARDETRTLLLGPRQGGRRYLSEDLADLDLLAAEVAGQVERLRQERQHRLLAEAELETLRAQINPHFLFNALNALYGVIPRAAANARETLLNLADIFRYALGGKRQFVSLEEELRIVEAYLQIERLRLGDRLSTRIELDDDARPLQVPALSIQPLVENAVKHGVSAKPEGGEVRVHASLAKGHLSVEVTDDGAGFDPWAVDSAGNGLANVRRRLHLCYGDQADFAIDSSARGTRVRFTVGVERRHPTRSAVVS